MIKRKKFITLLSCVLALILSMSLLSAASLRKNITKSASGSFYTNNMMRYSFSATAALSFDYKTNDITGISDLSFSNITCNNAIPGGFACMILPSLKSKTYTSKKATYVVTVKRNAGGFYVDNVDYTFNYYVTDSGTIYSAGEDSNNIEVEVLMGEPYNIEFSESGDLQ